MKYELIISRKCLFDKVFKTMSNSEFPNPNMHIEIRLQIQHGTWSRTVERIVKKKKKSPIKLKIQSRGRQTKKKIFITKL